MTYSYDRRASKRQEAVIEILRQGGYLTPRGQNWDVMDKSGKRTMPPIPKTTWLAMLKKRIIMADRSASDRRFILNPQWGAKKPRRKPGAPEGAVGYVHMDVLAGAYIGKADNLLTHAVWVNDRGDWLGDRTVCNKIDLERMADIGRERLTCKTCASRVRKSGLPRVKG